MKKLLKYSVYIYLIFAIVCLITAITEWNVERSRAYLMLFMAAVALFMFFFRRRFIRRFDDRNK
ncbi:hypothetical protein JCM19294_344 [Nonlabens tegetincola]|uniref:Uncharacterized protein n=1 Tax=Nonlabens tegetincola TaxID=323273 RepID=A0A090Q468_9FLAO|nr:MULTISPECIES: hypothetical protein [Nonlabens]ARN71890.1 hypothetical protein BST91_09635 [Nonlabens tegetincola]MEE2801630.1 hypothetical protein [Bacteroidota bacterium]PQJ20500.1 hypothetical protein BST93_03395 [Nonlabens tegetincola]GAK97805.1 hypothetical protein JCM19294_344 [Nonlabens tegetincola]